MIAAGWFFVGVVVGVVGALSWVFLSGADDARRGGLDE